MDIKYTIEPVKTSKDEIKSPKLAELGVIPKINSSIIIVGKSGSGKSVLLHNLLTNTSTLTRSYSSVQRRNRTTCKNRFRFLRVVYSLTWTRPLLPCAKSKNFKRLRSKRRGLQRPRSSVLFSMTVSETRSS